MAQPAVQNGQGALQRYPPRALHGWTEWPNDRPDAQDIPSKHFVVTRECAKEDRKKEGIGRRRWFQSKPLTAGEISRIDTLQLITLSKGTLNAADDASGLWTWFELTIRRPDDKSKHRNLPNGQSLAWYSHPNAFNVDDYKWRRGRIFTRSDGLFEHLRPGDVISVMVVASSQHENHAKEGYLLFGHDTTAQVHQKLSFHGDFGNPGNPDDPNAQQAGPADASPPGILVYGQRRRECVMVPTDGPPAGTESITVDSGVDLMGRLLQDQNWTVHPRLLEPENQAHPVAHGLHSAVNLYKFEDKDKKITFPVATQTVLNERLRPDDPRANIAPPPAALARPRIIVWDDSGVNRAKINMGALDSRADVLIYQMHAPLSEGKLWELARDDAQAKVEVRKFGAIFVVIDAEDLRAKGFHISRGISWEKTLEDFNDNLEEIMKRLSLPMRMHLIVRCGYEGAICLMPRKQGETPHFVTHMVPDKAEGDLSHERNGRMPGIDLAFVTGLAAHLVTESDVALRDLQPAHIGAAVSLALVRSDRFVKTGFRKDPHPNGAFNYPEAKDINSDDPKTKPNIIYVDSVWFRNKKVGKWSLFNLVETWRENIAAETIKVGTKLIQASVPTASYGDLTTADRVEIEGFRSTAAVIHEYLRCKTENPMSIAVFGQPGAGKSFGVKKVIKAVLESSGIELSKGWKPIEANLSQFGDYKDLVSIFDDVRDMYLKGDTPVVLFDEFDSSLNGRRLGWLKYFLAPMNDGQYLHEGHIRMLGRAIFVFIGGTSSTFQEFSVINEAPNGAGGNGANGGDQPDDKQAKKPDFVSRLCAHIDVVGPNSSHGDDKMFAMRRALQLRSMLERRLNIKKGKDIGVDETLLIALLRHKRFRHGSRSMTLILQMSRLSGCQRFYPSALPSDEQLDMHLDIDEFKDQMKKHQEPPNLRPIDIVLYNKLRWAEWNNGRA